jgi:signal transduction histidine kinase/sensor domain CHASE-containing protein
MNARAHRTVSTTFPAAWLVLVIGVTLSITAFLVVEKNIRNEAQLRFERQASDAHHTIQARIRSYVDIMYGLGALFRTSDTVTRAQFHRFVAGLDLSRRFPGFQSINYAVQVSDKDREKFEASVRKDTSLDPKGYPGFRIQPQGARPAYHVISFIEPMTSNQSSFGLDLLAFQKERAAAIEHMRDSGQLFSSGRLIVFKAPKPIIALAMRLPVYRGDGPLDSVEQRRNAFAGSLGSGFLVKELLSDVLEPGSFDFIRFRIYDAGPAGEYNPARNHDRPDRLLFDSKEPPPAPASSASSEPATLATNGDFIAKLPLEMAGRVLETYYTAPRSAVINQRDSVSPYIVLVGGILTSLLLFGIAYSLATSRSRAEKLADRMTQDLRQREQDLRNYAERLKAVSRRLVEVQEAERRTLAGEMHDRIGQNLTALGLNLGALRSAVATGQESAVKGRIADSSQLLHDTIESMRNLMSELRPQGLDDYGLVAPLRVLAAEYSGRSNSPAIVHDKSRSQRLPKQVEMILFRIAQEALNNAAKYAKATQVDITLTDDGETAVLSVKDDGIGFHVGQQERRESPGGYGLQIMRERAEAVGADIRIESGPGMGTTVIVTYTRTLREFEDR